VLLAAVRQQLAQQQAMVQELQHSLVLIKREAAAKLTVTEETAHKQIHELQQVGPPALLRCCTACLARLHTPGSQQQQQQHGHHA
jgi:DeoR/GlpR family transcriptional regulator of sugar metabolism